MVSWRSLAKISARRTRAFVKRQMIIPIANEGSLPSRATDLNS
jgi:hypothetical protein